MHRVWLVSRSSPACPLIVVGCTVLLLAGCTNVSRSSLDSVRLLVRGPAKIAPTAQQVAATPRYQLRAITAKGDAVLILGNIDNRRELWYGKDGAVVVLQHGRIAQTVGLDRNLDGSRVTSAVDPFSIGLHKLKAPLTYQRKDDWSPGYRYGVAVDARLSPAGNADIDILGTHHRVLLVTEVLTATTAAYRATNRYWVDPVDGFVWMSEQQVVPGLTFKLVQLRPYRGTQR